MQAFAFSGLRWESSGTVTSVFSVAKPTASVSFDQLAMPKTDTEGDALLTQLERLPDRRAWVPQLVQILGAGNRIWNMERRARLFKIIASAGDYAVGHVLDVVMEFPRAEVLDDAQLLLRSTEISVDSLRTWFSYVAGSARAVLITALAHRHDLHSANLMEQSLDDQDAEVRDAAASALVVLRPRSALVALTQRRARETDNFVRASIDDAIADIRVSEVPT
jgi:hypothetical protein